MQGVEAADVAAGASTTETRAMTSSAMICSQAMHVPRSSRAEATSSLSAFDSVEGLETLLCSLPVVTLGVPFTITSERLEQALCHPG